MQHAAELFRSQPRGAPIIITNIQDCAAFADPHYAKITGTPIHAYKRSLDMALRLKVGQGAGHYKAFPLRFGSKSMLQVIKSIQVREQQARRLPNRGGGVSKYTGNCKKQSIS
jgi:hypothetical protein